MKKFGVLPWVLGLIYTELWSYVYFLADHEWWPIFLHIPLYPLSLLMEYISLVPLEFLAVSSGPAVFATLDHITGAAYLLLGIAWYFVIGVAIESAWKHISPSLRENIWTRFPLALAALHFAFCGFFLGLYLRFADPQSSLALILLVPVDPWIVPLSLAIPSETVILVAAAVVGSIQWWGIGWLIVRGYRRLIASRTISSRSCQSASNAIR